MPQLRLTGRKVRAIRAALSNRAALRAAWTVLSADFHIPQLRKLPAEKLARLDPAPIPRIGRATHNWKDERLEAPVSEAGRSTGATLRAAYADGVSPVDVVKNVFAAHNKLGLRSPFIAVDEARAMKAAKASEARWRAGEPLGALDGLVVPVKDEFHMRGLATHGGASFRTERMNEDAWVVRQLEAAGAVVIGKTHATESGLNPCGVLEHFSGPRNVHSDGHAPGGSSTGSGVATALGLCASAVGTDGGGSIRIPASLNGVFGLKPTYLRIGRTGDAWGASTVAHIGPIGQSVADCVEQLAATAGVDPDDPITRWAPDRHKSAPWVKALGRGVRGARIGICHSEFEDADSAVAGVTLRAVKALADEGAELVDVSLPFGSLINGIGVVSIASESAANLRDDFAKHEAEFGAELAIILRLMGLIPAQEYLQAARARAHLRDKVAELFGDIDLLVLPTTGTVAPPYALSEDRMPVLNPVATAAMTRFNFLGNLTGLPAGTVPVGTVDGLPVGLQLVGDAWDEASVIAAMAHCERLGLHHAVPRPGTYIDILN